MMSWIFKFEDFMNKSYIFNKVLEIFKDTDEPEEMQRFKARKFIETIREIILDDKYYRLRLLSIVAYEDIRFHIPLGEIKVISGLVGKIYVKQQPIWREVSINCRNMIVKVGYDTIFYTDQIDKVPRISSYTAEILNSLSKEDFDNILVIYSKFSEYVSVERVTDRVCRIYKTIFDNEKTTIGYVYANKEEIDYLLKHFFVYFRRGRKLICYNPFTIKMTIKTYKIIPANEILNFLKEHDKYEYIKFIAEIL